LDLEEVHLTGTQQTALVTLYGKALDSRRPDSVLADREADQAVRRMDYDFSRLRVSRRDQESAAVRSKAHDGWVTRFLDVHPECVVLHLGCGLDSRGFRLVRPPGVQWFDVDVPQLIALRRKLYDDAHGYRTIGMSVTDPDWLDEIPAQHATLMVAEGLLPWLSEAENRQLFQRIIDRFSSGELIFDVVSKWVPWIVKLQRRWPKIKSGISDGRQIQQWNSQLRYLESTSIIAGYARIPLKRQRVLFRPYMQYR